MTRGDTTRRNNDTVQTAATEKHNQVCVFNRHSNVLNITDGSDPDNKSIQQCTAFTVNQSTVAMAGKQLSIGVM
jgi:hypothetical protein